MIDLYGAMNNSRQNALHQQHLAALQNLGLGAYQRYEDELKNKHDNLILLLEEDE